MDMATTPNVTNILHEYTLNLKWLQKNYDKLKQTYNKQWVLIEKQNVTLNSSNYQEIIAAKVSKNKTALVEFIDSEQVAMFF